MPQTTVPSTMAIGTPGQIADEWTAHNGDAFAGTNEEVSASIPFGCLAVRSSNEGVKLPTSLADVKVASGILIYESLFDASQLTDMTVNTYAQSGIKPTVTGSFLRRGRIYVIPESTGTEASGVFLRKSGTGTLGSFRAAAVVGETIVCTPFARWIGTPTAGQVCVLEIDLNNVDLATAS